MFEILENYDKNIFIPIQLPLKVIASLYVMLAIFCIVKHKIHRKKLLCDMDMHRMGWWSKSYIIDILSKLNDSEHYSLLCTHMLYKDEFREEYLDLCKR